MIVGPYVALGVVVRSMMVVFVLVELPAAAKNNDASLRAGPTVMRLLARPHFIWGLAEQAFYVGAQIMLWPFIIPYAVNNPGLPTEHAKDTEEADEFIGVSTTDAP